MSIAFILCYVRFTYLKGEILVLGGCQIGLVVALRKWKSNMRVYSSKVGVRSIAHFQDV